MKNPMLSRRTLLTAGSATLAGLALLNVRFAHAAPVQVIPWLDQPPESPLPPQALATQLVWEQVDSWLTPNDKFFSIAHYNRPEIDVREWQLEVTGLVKKPLTLTLEQIRARKKQDITFTLECSGNHGFPFFTGGIGNAQWGGTSLADLLKEAGIQEKALEVVFYGTDEGEETVREIALKQNFARSLSIQDAMNPNNLLCYEMNGAVLPHPNGFPLRLIAPGWYGIANVKWLKRIEVRDTLLMNRFMARDYVTIRKEEGNGETVSTETSVGRALLKSAPVRVVRKDGKITIQGAAWGAPIKQVEVQIDNGNWQLAKLDPSKASASQKSDFAWRFWTLDWPNPKAGEHAITARATDTAGNVQPAMADPVIANKQTYWESNGQITRKVKIA